MKKKVLIIGGIVLSLLVILLCVYFFLIKDNNKENKNNNQETLTAYTIMFDSREGSEVASIKINKGELYPELPIPVKEGYIFKGWETKTKELIEKGSRFDNTDTILYAVWEKELPDFYTIKFDAKGGSAVNSITVKKDEKVPNLPTSKRASYKFLGWKDETGKQITAGMTLEVKDITLYAQWQKTTTYKYVGYDDFKKFAKGYIAGNSKIADSEDISDGSREDGMVKSYTIEAPTGNIIGFYISYAVYKNYTIASENFDEEYKTNTEPKGKLTKESNATIADYSTKYQKDIRILMDNVVISFFQMGNNWSKEYTALTNYFKN